MNKPQNTKVPSRPYFLLSFIPALAYWLLETYSTLVIALAGGMLLGVIEMILEKRFTGHVHTLSKINLFLIVSLGGISLMASEGLWFKLQPVFSGLAICGILVFKRLQGQSLVLGLIKDMGQAPPLPEKFYLSLELHMAFFLFVFSLFMSKVAIYDDTSVWLFWKTGGFYMAFGIFLVSELIYLRWQVRRGP
jgi:intracellular septation protein